ncbi:hypothetical protein DL96DRAFT_1704512 [Flagelloscypha sp. PMI_526]|nr:hypothetical protein DL96DRAFT_1704512 [Flagelloscypha sp. PMI_526]
MPTILRNLAAIGLAAMSANSQARSPAALCEYCQQKPRFVEASGHKHKYCGKTCARAASQGVRTSQPQTYHPRKHTHSICKDCHHQKTTSVDHVCGQCRNKTTSSLVEVARDNPIFNQVQNQFLNDWRKADGNPEIGKLYAIRNPYRQREAQKTYLNAQQNVEEAHTYYGTQMICDLANPVLCEIASCGVCQIARSSFGSLAFGENYDTGRLGLGLYTCRSSGLADNFATSCTSSPFRVVIACNTIVNTVTHQPEQNATEEQLSSFVPISDAILPVYIIMYSK